MGSMSQQRARWAHDAAAQCQFAMQVCRLVCRTLLYSKSTLMCVGQPCPALQPLTTGATGDDRAPALMLAAFFDMQASYRSLGPDNTAAASIKGLRLETQVAAPSASLLADQEHVPGSRSVVLEPCSISVECSQRSRAGSQALDVHADMSSIFLRVSPDVLRLLLGVQRVLQPFAVASPNR